MSTHQAAIMETIASIKIVESHGYGGEIDYVLAPKTEHTMQKLRQAGVSEEHLALAQIGGHKRGEHEYMDIAPYIIAGDNPVKWFDLSASRFVTYTYEDRFNERYQPFQDLVSEENLQSCASDTQQFASILRSLYALYDFISDEREREARVPLSDHEEDGYRNVLLSRKDHADIIDQHTYGNGHLTLLAYLERDRTGGALTTRNQRDIARMLRAYLAIRGVLLTPGMYNTPVLSHLHRQDEVDSFLKQIEEQGEE